MADQVAKLEEEVRRLNDRMGALSLDNAGLSERTTEMEVVLVADNTAKGALENYILWILSDGLNRVVDRVIKSPQFLQGLVQVRVACVAARVEQGNRVTKELVIAREFNLEVEVDVATKT